MKTESKRTRTIRGLELCGFTRDTSARTSKYLVYASDVPSGVQYLVGKSGALRALDLDKPVSESRSLTGGTLHNALAKLGDGTYKPVDAAHGREWLGIIIGDSARRSARRSFAEGDE